LWAANWVYQQTFSEDTEEERSEASHLELVVKLLLAKDNVNPNSKDGKGETPPSYAIARGNEAVIELPTPAAYSRSTRSTVHSHL
jgi:hypothetical protein